MGEKVSPKLFISYSWSSPDHEQWVADLAIQLAHHGVHVLFDKWDLREGDSTHAFMERMVTDPDVKKVIMICDSSYAEKADKRAAGVGTETQIISRSIYDNEDPGKFAAVLASRNEHGNPYLPTYYKGRIYIDLSDHGRYAENFEKLLRWIYDKPLHKRPEIGPPPAFLQQTESIDVGTNIAFRRAIEAVRGGREHAYGAIDEYLGALALGIQKFRISFENQESFEERFLESIEAAYIYEVEFLNLIEAMAQYFERLEKPNSVHRFFERIAAYCYPDENTNSYRDIEFDNYKFIVHELFVSTIAILIKHERFVCASYLLETPYYVPKAGTIGEKSAQHYRDLFRDPGILEHRNRRLKLGRTSLQADLIKDRSTRGPIEFRNIMQADFVLYLYGAAKNFWWYPLTLSHLNFHAPEFEIFARASSSKYFEGILPIIGVSNKPELDSIVERFKRNEIQRPKWSWSSIDPVRLMGYEQLCTR